MRIVLVAFVAASLSAFSASAQTYGLGLGASSSDSVDLKVNGKTKTFHVTGAESVTGAQSFLNCLVAGRVVKVGAGATPRLSMLDNSEIGALLHEFGQSRTAADPCALGKAAYVPVRPSLNGTAPTTQPATAPATAAAPEPAKAKLAGGRQTAIEILAKDGRVKQLGSAYAGAAGSKAAAPAPTTSTPAETPYASSLPRATVESLQAAPTGEVSRATTVTPTAAPPTVGNLPSTSAVPPQTAPAPAAPPTWRPPV